MDRPIKTVSIIGLGALGILFGQRLARRLPPGDLRVVADQERIARYQSEGIYCNGARCDFYFIAPDADVPPADLVLFFVKIGGLEDACRAVRAQVGENTLLLSALNGVTSERALIEHFGAERVLPCVAQGMDAVREQNRLTYAAAGKLCFGDFVPGPPSESVRRVEAFFTNADFPHEVVPDMPRRMWGKLMLNCGVNQVVSVYKGDYETVQRPGQPRQLLMEAMREVLALARREGVNLTEEDFDYWLAVLDSLPPRGTPSMAQDLKAGRPTELALFAGEVLRLSEKHRLPTPANRMLFERIRAMERA